MLYNFVRKVDVQENVNLFFLKIDSLSSNSNPITHSFFRCSNPKTHRQRAQGGLPLSISLFLSNVQYCCKLGQVLFRT